MPILAAVGAMSCSKDAANQGKSGAGKPAPVLAAVVEKRAVPLEISTFGTAKANSSVTVKAQVTGILNKVHFKKGQEIKKDQLLFEIDPRPFVASLQQLQANKLRDDAQWENAKKELARQAELKDKKITAQADLDAAQTAAAVAEAAVKADQAAIDNAQLMVDYCTIRSPMDGRAGDTPVDEGNLVIANTTSLVTIDQINPIEVNFAIPQRDLPAVRKFMAQGTLKVLATIPGTDEPAEQGELTFVDNTIEAAAGTIRLGATFANKDQKLWPGLYVDVLMTLTVEPDAIVVPSQAVQTGRDGRYVFVIVPDKSGQLIAEIRPVTVSRSLEGITIIATGLAEGEQIVTDGQVRLLPGAKVKIEKNLLSGAMSKPGAADAGKKAPASTTASAPASQRAER